MSSNKDNEDRTLPRIFELLFKITTEKELYAFYEQEKRNIILLECLMYENDITFLEEK